MVAIVHGRYRTVNRQEDFRRLFRHYRWRIGGTVYLAPGIDDYRGIELRRGVCAYSLEGRSLRVTERYALASALFVSRGAVPVGRGGSFRIVDTFLVYL
jgi:hypothetical protein